MQGYIDQRLKRWRKTTKFVTTRFTAHDTMFNIILHGCIDTMDTGTFASYYDDCRSWEMDVEFELIKTLNDNECNDYEVNTKITEMIRSYLF